MRHKFTLLSNAIVLGLSLSAGAVAGTVETIQCKLSDCTLTCISKDQPNKTYGPAKEVTVEVHQGGVIKYELDRGIDGKQSVYVGPDSYMCTLNQP